MAALQGHIAEHLGFHYRNEIEKQMGVTMPNPEAELPPEMEAELSKLIAQASQQLLAENKAEAAQQKNEEMAKDPLIQMQQQELAIKQKDVQIKEQKVASDTQARMAQVENETTRIANQKEIDFARIQADMSKHLDSQVINQEMEQKRLGLEANKSLAQFLAQRDKRIIK